MGHTIRRDVKEKGQRTALVPSVRGNDNFLGRRTFLGTDMSTSHPHTPLYAKLQGVISSLDSPTGRRKDTVNYYYF